MAARTVPMEHDEAIYRCLVVDSGPIIKLSGVSVLWKKAESFYTVPAVLSEIRDAKARHHLDNLPFEIAVKDPSPEAVKTVIDFARKTGDYQSLSSVDIQVLALVYDLEKEGCDGDVSHLRQEPKRTLGLGKIQLLGGESIGKASPEDLDVIEDSGSDSDELTPELGPRRSIHMEEREDNVQLPKSCSWAARADQTVREFPTQQIVSSTDILVSSTGCGQFEDADEVNDEAEREDVIDEQPKAERNERTIDEELQLDFPSLAAAATVLVEDDQGQEPIDEDERKRRSLQPLSKTGKLYNSVPVAKQLAKRTDMKPKEPVVELVKESETGPSEAYEKIGDQTQQSRIIGGMSLAGQEDDVEDDGEGWITTASDIQSLKVNGGLDPIDGRKHSPLAETPNQLTGPPRANRTACASTDFAMQNVLLQMNMELLSVDGMKIKKLKSWVRRCGACFKVYTDTNGTGPIAGKRLFCDNCGSDMIQRIACSVDGKTGRLRLHLKKNYRHNLRGTKFSLPKPGSGDRFQGDLLLREDQLLTGTWGQKAKMYGGGKAKAASESIFGRDIATNVGCHVNSLSGDDIQVGFGRRNPNAAKGRERRGKKKKSTSRACGLRRY